MRIDYSEPKKSYITPQSGSNRTKKESSSPLIVAVIITGVISLAIGFGSGWVISQRYAKKGFQAALQQQSLENSPHPITVQPVVPKSQTAEHQQPLPSAAPPQPAIPAGQPAPETPLSFYKTLPSGHKSNVLGSGINAADSSTAKQPLQATIPTNLAKPQGITKPPPPASTEKPAAKPDSNGFTVQIASYSLKSEADTLKSKLASKGYNVHIVESNQGDKGTWYRVRVGKKLDQEAAKELAGKLGKGAISIPDKD